MVYNFDLVEDARGMEFQLGPKIGSWYFYPQLSSQNSNGIELNEMVGIEFNELELKEGIYLQWLTLEIFKMFG